MEKCKIKYSKFLMMFLFLGFAILATNSPTEVFAKGYDANSVKFGTHPANNQYLQIKNIDGKIKKIAKYKKFVTIQSNGVDISCKGSVNYNTSEVCYYNTRGKGFQAYKSKTGSMVDDQGRTVFESMIYGTENNDQLRMYFPVSPDKLYKDALYYTYGNQKLGNRDRNFKYYGIKIGDSTGLGYRWWNLNNKSYCYYKGGVKCKKYTSKTPNQIRNDAKGSGYYREGLVTLNGEKGEFRYLGYSSNGELYQNPKFPDDYPTKTLFKNYKWLNNPYSTLIKNGFIANKSATDLDAGLKKQATDIINRFYGSNKGVNTWSIQGNPNYDPLVANGSHTNKKNYKSGAVPTRAEALKGMHVKQIKVCQGAITNINDCHVVGEWTSNGSNYYANGSTASGTESLVYGEIYTVFTKLTNDSVTQTSINGTATVGEPSGYDADGDLTINNSISASQGSKIPASSDSSWIAMKPFTAGQRYINGKETVVSGVSSVHLGIDDNDAYDNFGAIIFDVIPAGNMEIIKITAYDVADTNNSNPVTKLINGKEYKFVIDTKFTPTIKGWTSRSKVVMPLNVSIDRVFTNGSSEHNTQIAYPVGSAYQTLSERTYQYAVYGTAGMPGTDVTVTAEFTKSNSSGFNSIINSKDKVSAKYEIPTINADLVVTGPVYAIDKDGKKYSTESNQLDSSKTYKLAYEVKYNGDVISKEAKPIKTDFSCYYTDVTSSTSKVACNNVEGLVEDGTVKSVYVNINGTRYNLYKSGNAWYSGTLNVTNSANIKLYVNDVAKGTFTHNLSSPVYRGAGYPTIHNVEHYGKITNYGIGMTRETKSYFDIDFAKVAAGGGKNVVFQSTTKTYYGLPHFNHEFWYRTDNNGAAYSGFAYANKDNKVVYSRKSNLNTNKNNDTYWYRNNVNFILQDVTVYPGVEEILEGDDCPIYEVRYNIRANENAVVKNGQGLITTQIKFAGKTYTFRDYVVEGDNKYISHILNNVDCSKIDDGKKHDVTVTINTDRNVSETTYNDNEKTTDVVLKVVDKDKPEVEYKDMMDVEKHLGYDCDTTTNTISWTESHTVRNWKESVLGDVKGYTSSTSTVSKKYEESYKITEVGFASKDTDWQKVNILNGSSNAKIKAGYGFKLTTTVEYNSNVLANNIALNNSNNGTSGRQVSNLNIEAYLPSVMYAEYNGTTYALYATSTTNSNGKIVRTYAYSGKYNGKDTNKIYTDVNEPDGVKTIKVSTPKIIGIPTRLNKCLKDSRNVNFIVDGSMYDDMGSHITQ